MSSDKGFDAEETRYLLIEDSASDAALLEAALFESWDRPKLNIHRCTSLTSGIAAAGREPYDIVLLDLNLPDSNGVDTFHTFNSVIPSIPTVILTSAVGEDFAERVMEEGAQDVIFKDRLDPYWIKHTIRRAKSRHQMQQRIRHVEEVALNVAKSANQAKTEFLSALSHEIRTPLGAMIMATDMLLQESEDESENKYMLQMIRRNGDHLLKLLNDVLDLSKIEAGCLGVEETSMNLRDEISDIIGAFSPLAESSNVELIAEVNDDVAETIWTDPTRFRQILSNLVSNALKFTKAGSVSVSVLSRISEGKRWLSVAVSDSGIGMTDEQASKLFQAFTQADASIVRRFGGTGLGLSLAKNLALALGGDLTLERSEVGYGSTFLFRFIEKIPLVSVG